MLSRFTKSALICAVLPIGLLAGGCSSAGEGYPGYEHFAAGHYAEAKADFTTDMNDRPNSPYSQFNIGDSYRQEGDNARANGMFHQAAASGYDIHPDRALELGGQNSDRVSIRTLACRHLHEDRQLDVNCDDRIAEIQPVAITEAPPTPVAVEAQATSPPVYERKQDRN